MFERGEPRPGAWICSEGTWLDSECDGARRARVICPDGRHRILRVAGESDTFFSISVIGGKVDGRGAYIHAKDGVLYMRLETGE